MSPAYLLNSLWMASCFREHRAFERAAKRVEATQADLLRQIVARNRNTWFGVEHGFSSIKSAADFQDAIPLTTYEDSRAALKRIANGEQSVLTSDRVRLFVPTGGSTSGEKLIPYTASLKQSFQRAIRAWIWDLYSRRPAVRHGRAYWSISPLAQIARRTTGGLPIGFEDDASYLGRFASQLARRTMAVPAAVALCRSVDAARYATLFFLLRAADLSLISVWSPTFLTELLRVLRERHEELGRDIAAGKISGGSGDGDNIFAGRQFRPMPQRAARLRRVFQEADTLSQCVATIWPRLALVSCWADGPSRTQANNLRQHLPTVEIQPKGLLATEAVVTFPLVDQAGPALAIRSHFFEFRRVDVAGQADDARPLLAHELVAGGRYRVVVTNGGGLYRYEMQDEVEVAGFSGEVPLLRFVGKTDDVVDLVGEKLQAAHVESALQAALGELRLSPTYTRLRAENSSPPGYVLEIAAATLGDDSRLQDRLRTAVEQRLESNDGYGYARRLRQLEALQIEVLSPHQADERISVTLAERVAAGKRLGDIKPGTF